MREPTLGATSTSWSWTTSSKTEGIMERTQSVTQGMLEGEIQSDSAFSWVSWDRVYPSERER